MSSGTSTIRAPHEAIVIRPPARDYSVRRYYDPATGQFLSVDPLVDQTEAPYAYVNGDPVDNSDPTGLFCIGSICTHSFDPMASLDAIVNIGRGATFGLTDRIANWIVPGASCTVPQDSLDQFIGSSATTLLGGGALGALLKSARFGDLLARLGEVDWADETGAMRLGRAPEYYGGQLTNDQAVEAAAKWLGPGYTEVSPGRFVSADGERIVRYGADETQGAVEHIHFEAAVHGHVIENTWAEVVP
jgi:hypothetical protein